MDKIIKIPELIAPAGSLESAIYAFNAGADAVYFGLSSFSARKYAVNFDEKQYRKLLFYAKNNNKKVYLTLNTIIKEDELEQLFKLLKFLQIFPPDSIIIQDFGIISLIKYFLKDINIHASTQSGTYCCYSYELIKNLGIKRVILARENSLNDIDDIKKEFKEIEIEIFIHGALCYSFSGYCLASGILLKRSGNKGECAQICRNYFNFSSKTRYGNLDLTSFSCNDLNLNKNIIKLAKIGVDSFKIEGRMKDPEYTFNTVKNYRNILDRFAENPEDFLYDHTFNNNSKNIFLSFSRIPTNGYFNHKNGEKLINPFFPFHIGTNLGTFKSLSKNSILVKLEEDISQRDGVLLLVKIEDRIISFPFSAVKIFTNNIEVYKAHKGQIVKISSPSLIAFYNIFNSKYTNKQKKDKNIFSSNINLDEFNLENILKSNFFILRKISDRNLDLKKINENLLKEQKLIIPIEFKIDELKKIDSKIAMKKLDIYKNYKIENDIDLYDINMIYSYNILDRNFKKKLNFIGQKRIGDRSYLEIFEHEISKSQKEDNFEIKANLDFKLQDIFDKIFVQPSLNKKIINQIKDDVRKSIDDFLNFDYDIFMSNSSFKNFPFPKTFFEDNSSPTEFFKSIDKTNIINQKNLVLDKLYKNNIIIDNFFYRKKISPKNYIEQLDDDKFIPFITFDNLKESDIEKNKTIYKVENIIFLPLHPIIDNVNIYIESIEKMIERNPEFIFIFGINSTWHFYFYKKYLNSSNVFFYFDFYIYIANIVSYMYYSNYNKSLFGLFWIEFQDEIKKELNNNKLTFDINKNLPLFELKDFNPPLFISRGCLQRNIFNDFTCEKDCKKKYIYKLKNQKNEFLYIIQNCISYFFKIT
ncbi:MAG: U32 family peptidase [Exilispira sp.]|jgi:collagenase-like PrtC family protease|nr:U32 family peptidase [Exilispira sp.]